MPEPASSDDVLQQFVDRAQSLYTLPAVAVELLELADRPEVDVQAMKRCVERDPALTARVLRVVNSSMFGLSREVTSLSQALSLLGVKPLKLLVLGFSLPPSLFRDVEAEILERYWRFTLVKAVASRQLAVTFWERAGDEAFVAGLLQEIGVLVLIHELGEPYNEFLKAAVQQGDRLTTLEIQTLGFDHTALSGRLLDHWSLPPTVIDAIEQPHEIEHLATLEPERQALPQILHLATLIASIIVDGRGESALAELLAAGDRYRRIAIDRLEPLLDELQEQYALMADVFCVRTGNQPSFRDILAQAHTQLARLANDVLPDLLAPAAPCDPETCPRQDDAFETARTTVQDPAPSGTGPERSPGTAAARDRGLAAVSLDAATLVASDPGLLTRLHTALAMCRLKQCELSLALLEIENYDELLTLVGPDQLIRAVRSVERVIQGLPIDGATALLVTDARCAIVLPQVDRHQAVELAKRLIAQIPQWSVERFGLSVPLRCSGAVVTAAVIGPNYPATKFLDAAERCLFAAQASGGNIVKSIDVF